MTKEKPDVLKVKDLKDTIGLHLKYGRQPMPAYSVTEEFTLPKSKMDDEA